MEWTIEELAVIKQRCLKSFKFFTRFFFKNNNNKRFVISEHHEIIFNHLEDVIRGDCKRLIINIAPRYGKTELSVKNFISYCLSLNPSSKFIHLSYADSLALDNSEEVKDLVNSDLFQIMFNVETKQDSRSKKKWYTTKKGGVYATGTAGQVTGFGAGSTDLEELENELNEIDNRKTFGGAIIIDDPIKPEDADSDTVREKINKRFDSTIRNRVNSRNTPIIVIMQRLHENDLTGHLIKTDGILSEDNPEGWKVVSMPSIKEDGTALWSEKHTIEELEDMRIKLGGIFEKQYMQNPIAAEGMLFPKDELNYFELSELDLDQVEGQMMYIDVADQGNDYYCAVACKIVGQKIFVNEVICNKNGLGYNKPKTAEYLNTHKPEFCRIESNNMGYAYATELQKEVSPTQLLKINNSTNKHTRIVMQSEFIKNYFYFRTDYKTRSDYDNFMSSILRYKSDGTTKKDVDPSDAVAGLSNMVRGFLPHLF